MSFELLPRLSKAFAYSTGLFGGFDEATQGNIYEPLFKGHVGRMCVIFGELLLLKLLHFAG